MGDHYFTFTVGLDTEQYRVTVYYPAETIPPSPIAGLKDNMRVSKGRLEELLNRLLIRHIDVEPNPTKTLVNNGSDRIDTQPATIMYRNIHFQAGNHSYAVVTVERGGELCFGGYKIKLFGYIKRGLNLSFQERNIFRIRVTVEKKEKNKPKSSWTPVDLYVEKELVKLLGKVFENKIQPKVEEIISKRMISAKNTNKIAKETDLIDHIAAAIERRIAKTTEKEGAHAVTKKIPIVSTVLGLYFAATRLSKGDWAGAFLEMASGVVADLPGAGTLASLGIDAVLLSKDIIETIADERKHQRFAQADIERLHQENARIREELATILPESPIYGGGRDSYFDESELADLEDIVQIKVRSADLIDAIQVIYRSQSGKQHGGNGGRLSTFDLGTGEKITMVSGTTIESGGVISSLSLHTDYGRQKTFGIVNGQEFQFEMIDGSYLGAIKGYDAYSGGRKTYPPWQGNTLELLPAIGFIPKF